MAIWQQFWPQIWAFTGYTPQSFGVQKKKEEEIPRTSMFAGFNEKQIAQLERDTAELPVNEKSKVQEQIYREVLPQVQAKKEQEKRMAEKNALYSQSLQEKDPNKKKMMEMTIKMWDIADMAREKGKLGIDIKDDQIIDAMVNGIENWPKLFEDYMNNWNEELLYVAGLKERPVEEDKGQFQSFTDVTAWALSSATWLPRFVANKSAEAIGWAAKQLWADENRVNELVESYKQSISQEQLAKEMGADTESMAFKWTKWLWDVVQIAAWWMGIEKWVAKWLTKLWIEWTKTAGKIWVAWLKWAITWAGTTQLGSMVSKSEAATIWETTAGAVLWGVIWAWVGWYKAIKAAKQSKIWEIIAPKLSQKEAELAIIQKRAKMAGKWIKQKIIWGKSVITPTDKISQAENIIKSEIVKPSTNPVELHNQIDDLITSKAKSLNKPLSSMKIWMFTKDKAKTIKLIQDKILKNSAVNKLMTPKEIKEIELAVKNIKSAKTANELWEARKWLDLATSQNVKEATELSSDILQYKQWVWKQARWELNSLLDKSVAKYWNISTKTEFNKMSALYEAKENILTKSKEFLKPTKWILDKENLKQAWLWLAITAAGAWWLKSLTN